MVKKWPFMSRKFWASPFKFGDCVNCKLKLHNPNHLSEDTPKGTWCLHLKFFSFTVVPGCCANGLFMIMNAVLVYSFCSKWLFPDYCQGGVSELLEYSAIKSPLIFLKNATFISVKTFYLPTPAKISVQWW